MTVAVITIVSGRHEHLRNQQIGLAHSLLRPDVYVVVSMDDPAAVEQTRAGPMSAVGGRLCTIMVGSGAALPLAAARNAGAATALAAGADQLIFLDVDCVPIPALVGAYVRSLTTADEPALHCGVVRYLGPEIDLRVVRAGRHLGEPHPARPNPPPGALQPSGEWALFWSLSFAVTASTWRRVGGFD